MLDPRSRTRGGTERRVRDAADGRAPRPRTRSRGRRINRSHGPNGDFTTARSRTWTTAGRPTIDSDAAHHPFAGSAPRPRNNVIGARRPVERADATPTTSAISASRFRAGRRLRPERSDVRHVHEGQGRATQQLQLLVAVLFNLSPCLGRQSRSSSRSRARSTLRSASTASPSRSRSPTTYSRVRRSPVARPAPTTGPSSLTERSPLPPSASTRRRTTSRSSSRARVAPRSSRPQGRRSRPGS